MKSLLVVVDMQRDFVSGPLGTKEAQNILPAVVRRIQEFQGDVVYTRDTHNGNYLQTQEGQQLPVVHCVQGPQVGRLCQKCGTRGRERPWRSSTNRRLGRWPSVILWRPADTRR